MKCTAFCLALLGGVADAARANTRSASPISKIISLISDLQGKIVAEGEEAQKVYDQFAEVCDDRSKDLQNDIKTSKAQIEELTATIAKEESNIEALTAKIEEIAASIAKDDADLQAAIKIRKKEAADFVAEEKELVDTVDLLNRAIGILEKEMAKGGASMLQLGGTQSITQALSALVEASFIGSRDAAKLTALVQQQSDDADSQEPGAPAATVYEGHSGDIISTLEGLLEKAEQQLDVARKEEVAANHAFEMTEQSLEDEMKVAKKDLAESKKGLAKSGEAKAAAEGDLKVTNEALKVDTTALDDLHTDCMGKAQDFEAAVKSRGEEIAAITKAKQVLQETTGAADAAQYGLAQTSFFQIKSRTDLAHLEAAHALRDLARKENSPALAQLASRVAAALRSGGGEDIFAKVKGMITDMISKLESEADEDATHKAYCDKEMKEANDKKTDKEAEVEKLTVKIEQMTARSAKLKEEVSDLQKSLSELQKSQAEMDQIRSEEKADYTKLKAELEQGLGGVKKALKILRDYYGGANDAAHGAASGAGSSILGLLEVVESDLTKSIAEGDAAEETAAASYKAETNENEIEKTSKEQDVKYKSKEAADLDKSVSETTADRAAVSDELDAVLDTLKALEAQCVAKAETYEERKAKREAEIAGLKEALSILESETALIQSGSKRSIRRH